MKLLDFVPNNSKITIAISGLNKNAGKTVVLNRLLTDAVALNKKVAITSIGYDGENTDMLDGHQKPQIHVSSGTIVATASSIIEKTKHDIEVIKATGIYTPLGEVYIVRYHQNSFTEIVGPSSLSGLIKLKQMMINLVDFVIVDGALNRISQLSPKLCDVAFFAVGGRRNIDEILEKTTQQLYLMNLPIVPQEIRVKTRQLLLEGKCALITEGIFTEIPCNNILLTNTNKETLIIFKGALTFSVVKALQARCKGVIVSDISSIFVSSKHLKAIAQSGFKIYVGFALPLGAITLNPTDNLGHTLNIVQLGTKISNLCPNLPVIDVVSSLCFKGGKIYGRLE